ncbi:5-oxoprolinase subunit PxpA [Jiella sp. MQZ9-1]|uniref:5-oxoprolinase subunit PxpA n=1 Tax=Jiella flava TaxID=2816857 RepID=A0A939JUX5_9HYPH|nr:5-oxoprolinase subunit PxpA [Jiella flava]MBO0661417.1 5-oxoprolinase subunit PxpA [Jiella flava]MCD2470060.1 5-oxoprolinase subunit PxpA [Jiella flava]
MVTLNCDMGESYGNWQFGDDAGIMPYVDCANIACGFHAGDPITMHKAVALAVDHGKDIGAHPSLPDREGFGRREMRLPPEELRAAFIYQIGALAGVARAHGASLSHVKPHGIIYGMAAREDVYAVAIAQAVKVFDLPLFGMAGTQHELAAEAVGVPFVGEFFADLNYGPAGQLIIPRIHSAIDLDKASARLARALAEGKVQSVEGNDVDIRFSTVCIHSDPPNSREVAATMRRVLDTVKR